MLFCQTLILLFATVTSATISARQSGQPDGVAVTQVSNSGSGCRDSLNYSITPDNSIVLSHFDDFYVSTGPSISPAERSKNCALHASFTYPAGWQFMLIQSTYSGYARLDPGVGGHFYTQYFVSSNAANTVGHRITISPQLDLLISLCSVLRPNRHFRRRLCRWRELHSGSNSH